MPYRFASAFTKGAPTEDPVLQARRFEHAELVVQPGAGHFPWLDDPVWFTRTLAAFLG